MWAKYEEVQKFTTVNRFSKITDIGSLGLRNEGTPFTLQAAGPSRVLDDQVKWRSCVHLETLK